MSSMNKNMHWFRQTWQRWHQYEKGQRLVLIENSEESNIDKNINGLNRKRSCEVTLFTQTGL